MPNPHVPVSAIKEATLRLKQLRGVDGSSIDAYIRDLDCSDMPTLEATASIIAVLFYGRLEVNVKTEPYDSCAFDAPIWGVGASEGDVLGWMSSNGWSSFFRDAQSFYVQGVAAVGGFLQVSWFSGSGRLIGQFNGLMAGAGGIAAGGSGEWKCE